ncbi:hypothetical protein D9M69_380490 [compost metagenome]
MATHVLAEVRRFGRKTDFRHGDRHRRRRRGDRRQADRRGQAQVLRLDQPALLEDQGPLDGVVQLAHVARPGVADQAMLRLGGKTHPGLVHFPGVLGQQAFGQRQDVGGPLAQRPPGQREHRQAIVEVFAETPRRHFAGQVAVAGGQHADVQADRPARADPLHLPLLQHAQQLGLQAQRHLGNLVEQNGAAVGQLELARLGGDGTGEGALLVAEQGSLEHVVGNRRTVDGDERIIGARRLLVNVARQHFLAGAGLAGDQHGGIAARHPCRQFEQLPASRFVRHRTVAVDRQAALRVTRHQLQQHLGLERLDQVIGRALANRLHRALHRAERGHQQHRQLRVLRADAPKQLVAIHARHVDVADHQAEGLALQRRQRRLGAVHRQVRMAAQRQGIGQRLAQRAIVFDQQDFGCHRHYS